MPNANEPWQALTEHMGEVTRLGQIQGLLSWDQQVNLPPSGHGDRGAHAALISGLIQSRVTDPKVGQWIGQLQGAPLQPLQAAGLRNHKRIWERANKVPADLAARQARAAAEGYAAWHKSRKEGDFGIFAPTLQTHIDLNREEAASVDPNRHPYDVLLESYDPGTTLADLRATFGRLRVGLVELIDAVSKRDVLARLSSDIDIDKQRELHRRVTAAMGYALDRGRIDDAIHPFTVGIGADDVRITTRLYGEDLLAGLGGTMHEAGHALYELGIPKVSAGTGIDSAASLGVHESQSRFWENYIGRSLPFFEWFTEVLDEVSPGSGIRPTDLYRGANRIVPSPIRIYADEVTYNLHIIVRFELEVALIEGSLRRRGPARRVE